MYRTNILAAGIACASAVTIKSKTEAEWGFISDIGDAVSSGVSDIGDTFSDWGGDIGNAFTSAWGDVTNAFDDLGDWASNDVGGWLVDTGSAIGNAFEDAFDWASDGGNWEAFGTTLAGGTVALLTGNPD